ncbi:LysR family transcriptional regulator [Thalassospira profundimaris]|uniref:LysR family transcriptional regulator n=1 Tax=Thalassospira profundimaris TaxID=502049 RepID=A0A367X3U9_9PROT|nr:LysR family transcriptional regulator [Thalassospira profundimaris]RCK48344.1 LysR family transcriptional regulator [Thalassospira profundimaris]
MDTRELQTLIAVAEEKSFHGAASRLGLTQPAVTRRIQRLETRTGCALFDRTVKPLRPTPAGQRALAEARDLLRRLAGFTEMIKTGISPQAPLKIGVSYGVAPLVTAETLHGLHQNFPDSQLGMRTGWSGELLPLLRRGEIDALLTMDDPLTGIGGVASTDFPKSIRIDDLFDDRIRPIGPASAPNPPHSIKDLADRPMVLLPEGCCFRALGNLLAHRHGLVFNSILEVSALDMQIDMIAAGVGYGITAERYARLSRNAANLTILDIPDACWSMRVVLLRRAVSPTINRVLDGLIDTICQVASLENAQNLLNS